MSDPAPRWHLQPVDPEQDEPPFDHHHQPDDDPPDLPPIGAG